MSLVKRAWARVHKPRVISAAYAVIYAMLGAGGVTALVDPPSTIEGALGEAAMMILALLLILAGITGAPSALIGAWWLERIAVMSVVFSMAVYAATVLEKEINGTGNWLVQLAVILSLIATQIVRWHQIRQRPYDPDRDRG